MLLLVATGTPVDAWLRPPDIHASVVSSSPSETVLELRVADPGIPNLSTSPSWLVGLVAVGPVGDVTVEGLPAVEAATVGEPVVWRELRVVPLWVRPDRLGGGTASLTVVTSGTGGSNPKLRPRRPVSPSFRELYRSAVLNFESIQFPPPRPGMLGGVYLALCPDHLETQAQTLARWHHEAGLVARVVTLSDMGGTSEQVVKSYLQNAYDTWDPAPEFVQILGDVEGFTGEDFPAKLMRDLVEPSYYHSDHWYALLEGNDYFPDVFVGRLPGRALPVVAYMVTKILDYQRYPYVETVVQPWQRKAAMVSGSYASWPSIDATKRLCAQRLYQAGYQHVDSLFLSLHASALDIVQAVNAGRSFVNYRGYNAGYDGWAPMGFFSSHVDQYVHNGRKLPVVMSISCFSGDYAMHHCFGECWLDVREGDWSPRGAAGFFGSTGSTHTRHNNWLDKGLFLGLLFNPENTRFGPVTDFAKAYMYQTCGPSDTTENTFRQYCVLGDVAMPLWTWLPRPMAVMHPETIGVGPVPFTLTVQDTSGDPLDRALVCLLKEDADPLEVYVTGETDAANGAQLVLPVTTQVPGTMLVTVTARNFVPYQDTVIVWGADQVPPAVPQALTVDAVGPSQALLSWEPVTDDVNGDPEQMSHYEVFRSPTAHFDAFAIPPLALVPAPSTQYLDTTSGVEDVACNSFYSVVALDSSWNRSGPSDPAGEFDFGTAAVQ